MSVLRQEAQIGEAQGKLESERRACTEKVDALTVSRFVAHLYFLKEEYFLVAACFDSLEVLMPP